MNDSRSLIRYSQRSSDSECIALQDQDLEHEHMIERRTSAFPAIAAGNRRLQRRPEHLEIDQHAQSLEIIALG